MQTKTQKNLAHRNGNPSTLNNTSLYDSNILLARLTYGVPTERRLLTPGVFIKKFHRIRDYLVNAGLTAAERQVALNLLRLYCYYGKVYPKASEFIDERGCSPRTFWRAVTKLEDMGLIDRINRYLHHLQISNAYRLDKLVLVLARWLAEHGHHFTDNFTLSLLRLTAVSFWQTIWTAKVRLRDPHPITP
jgi:hypothetical protein